MSKLSEEFIKEMNLEGATVVEKAIAGEMLMLTITEPSNKFYKSFVSNDMSTYFVNDVLADKALTSLVNISGYWSNGIAVLLSQSLRDKGINSPLAKKDSPVELYKPIFDFLDEKLKK